MIMTRIVFLNSGGNINRFTNIKLVSWRTVNDINEMCHVQEIKKGKTFVFPSTGGEPRRSIELFSWRLWCCIEFYERGNTEEETQAVTVKTHNNDYLRFFSSFGIERFYVTLKHLIVFNCQWIALTIHPKVPYHNARFVAKDCALIVPISFQNQFARIVFQFSGKSKKGRL